LRSLGRRYDDPSELPFMSDLGKVTYVAGWIDAVKEQGRD